MRKILFATLFISITLLYAESFRVTEDANLRDQPTAASNVITVLHKDTILDGEPLENSKWCKINYKGETRYISKSVIEVIDITPQNFLINLKKHPVAFTMATIFLVLVLVALGRKIGDVIYWWKFVHTRNNWDGRFKLIGGIIGAVVALVASYFVVLHYVKIVEIIKDILKVIGFILFLLFSSIFGVKAKEKVEGE